jgi:hypothetical protein
MNGCSPTAGTDGNSRHRVSRGLRKSGNGCRVTSDTRHSVSLRRRVSVAAGSLVVFARAEAGRKGPLPTPFPSPTWDRGPCMGSGGRAHTPLAGGKSLIDLSGRVARLQRVPDSTAGLSRTGRRQEAHT